MTHPVRESATERGIIDGGARYLSTRRRFMWSKARFSVSTPWTSTFERHTMAYRIWWCGPDNDRDHCRW